MPVGDVTSSERGSGARYNDNKPQYSQIPLHLLEDTARVFEYGEKKYAKFNWLKGMDWSIPYDSMMRHMTAWYRGEDNDQESGLPHLAHAMCNLLMLTAYADNYKDGDNRPNEYFEEVDVVELHKEATRYAMGEYMKEAYEAILKKETEECLKK